MKILITGTTPHCGKTTLAKALGLVVEESIAYPSEVLKGFYNWRQCFEISDTSNQIGVDQSVFVITDTEIWRDERKIAKQVELFNEFLLECDKELPRLIRNQSLDCSSL